MNTKRDILLRVYLSLLVFILAGILIVSQIVKIQYVEGSYYRSLSDSLTTVYASIEPTRGNIYSSDGRLMVASLPIYEIRLDLKARYWTDKDYYKKHIDSLCIDLANLFKDRSRWEYKRSLEAAHAKKARYYLLKRNVNHNQLKELKTFPFLSKGKFSGGLIVEQKSRRIHPFNFMAERTLGYTYKQKDSIRGVGLEMAYQTYLAGVSGKRLMQKISGGNWIPINYDNEIEPLDGEDIISTIDINIQDATERALIKALENSEADHGCAVVMEVKTGRIKAISNFKRKQDGSFNEEFNYAVGSISDPGSTFKLATSIILLETGLVKPSDSVDTYFGKRSYFEREMSDGYYHKPAHATFKHAFEKSFNVAISSLVFDNFRSRPNEFLTELDKLHITQKLGIPIPGEGIPVFKRPGNKGWSGVSLPWMSIGYSIEITPLQLLTLYNAVANNGTMVKPQFVEEVRKVGTVTKTFSPKVIDSKICSQKTCDYLKEMMIGVVNEGTARNIKGANYQIAGKTGTSKMFIEGEYQEKYQASFAGFFPAEKPRYSIIVVIYQPTLNSYYGGAVAAPVFREISDMIMASEPVPFEDDINNNQQPLDIPVTTHAIGKDMAEVFSYLNLPVQKNNELENWVAVKSTSKAIALENIDFNPNTIPDVRGMYLSDAVFLLENLRLKVNAKGLGKVVSQSLAPGSRLVPFSSITLNLDY